MNIINAGIKQVIISVKKRILIGHAPDFIIVGAQKSGTSSLYYYLSQHPNLLASTPKEVRYFDRDENFEKGKKWYHRSFINKRLDKKNYLCFEATPEYLYRSFVAKRMYQEYPDLKIIIILRQPIKRAYSAWNMYRNFWKTKRRPKGYIYKKENNLVTEFFNGKNFISFEDAIASEILKIKNNSEFEEPALLRRGIYLPQIKRYHDIFGKDQVLILGNGDLKQNKKETLNKVLRFLNLKENDWSFIHNEPRNIGNYSERMSKETEDRLDAFYEPYNSALFKYLGTEINW